MTKSETIKNIEKIQEILKSIRFGKGADTEMFCAFCKKFSWNISPDEDYEILVDIICEDDCPFNEVMNLLDKIKEG